jgi:hypothetical protein
MEIHKINSLGNTLEIESLRKDRLIGILKKENKDESDFKFIQLFIQQYFDEVQKSLKNLTTESMNQLLGSLSYKEVNKDEILFNTENALDNVYLVLTG